MNLEATEKEYGDVSAGVSEFCGDALMVQDACNLSGVVHSFARVMAILCDDARRLGKGTDWINHHPIAVLFASKIDDMVQRKPEVTVDFSNAYSFCFKHRS
jgi:hypothetical protein